MSGLNADHLFLGVDGLDPEIGLTTPDVLEAQLNSLMIRMAREVTVVADSSKFSKRSLSVIAGVGDSPARHHRPQGRPADGVDAARSRASR